MEVLKNNDIESWNYCALPLADYASRPELSRGRIYNEEKSAERNDFHRDRDRIIHSAAFRRLKYKTQVFVYHEGDHYRTRLSHTLEVAQITRTLARALMINEDLAEAVALAHDLGHTPFAHMGEDFLKICMKDYGGFDHNDQSLRILTMLENKYPRWRGLNLTWETIEGVIKHNGPVTGELPVTLSQICKQISLDLNGHASLEAQAAAIADDIAYNNHDVEDGLNAKLFDYNDLSEISIFGENMEKVKRTYPDIEKSILGQEVIREMIGAMVNDVLAESRKRIKEVSPKTPDDVRSCGVQLITFSDEMEQKVTELRKFLFSRMYHHYTLRRIRRKVERIVTDLFEAFYDDYLLLPARWQKEMEQSGNLDDKTAKARVICDYIAGMTDRFAIAEHDRMFNIHNSAVSKSFSDGW